MEDIEKLREGFKKAKGWQLNSDEIATWWIEKLNSLMQKKVEEVEKLEEKEQEFDGDYQAFVLGFQRAISEVVALLKSK